MPPLPIPTSRPAGAAPRGRFGRRDDWMTPRTNWPRLGLATVLALVTAWAASTAAGEAPQLTISFEQGLVTLSACDAPLASLVEVVAEEAGLTLEIDGRLEGRITLDCDRLALREALRRLLRGQGFALRAALPARIGRGQNRCGASCGYSPTVAVQDRGMRPRWQPRPIPPSARGSRMAIPRCGCRRSRDSSKQGGR